MNLLARGAEFQGSPGVAVNRTLGSNGSCGGQLHQLRYFLIERAGMLGRGSQGVDGFEKIGVLTSQTPKRCGFQIPAYHS
jgi:hypothetical protein